MAADGSLVVSDTYNEMMRVVLAPFKLAFQTAGAMHTATLSWDSIIGKKYQVEYQADAAGPWNDLGPPATATGFSLSATDNTWGGGPQRLYRVVLVTP